MTTKSEIRNNAWDKLMHAVGFKKTYNFILWFIFSGALFGFLLSRTAYLNFNIFCYNTPGKLLNAAPGECYYYINFDRYYIGIRMHLFAIIIGGLLACFQFVPIIRYKAILFHRINGYIVILGVIFSHIGALMIANVAFGGGLSVTIWVGVLAIATTISIFLAWVNIKRLQIDQHRAWMLRTWFYLASIITERLIFMPTYTILSGRGYYYAMPCDKIASFYPSSQPVLAKYPGCAPFYNGTNPTAHVAVLGDMHGTGPEQAAAMLDKIFGACLWLGIVLNAVGVEIYLHLTPAESARLRQVSYQRQLEKKFKNPGNAGLTVQKLGDAEPFIPKDEKHEAIGDKKSTSDLKEDGRRSSELSKDSRTV